MKSLNSLSFMTILLLSSISLLTLANNDTEELGGQSHTIIFRCCKNNEDLEKPTNGSPEVPRCISSEDEWKPKVYSPDEGKFVDIPNFWSIQYNYKPKCNETSRLSYIPVGKYNPNFILFDEGDVALDGGNGPFLGPEEYCLGTNSLLACVDKKETHQAAATMRPRLLRCCGENAAYERNACAESKDQEDKSILSKIPSNMEIATGFPLCPGLDNYTIIGHAKDTEFKLDGSIIIDGATIPAENFCIERITDDVEGLRPFKVFACSEHAHKGSVRPIPTSLPTGDIRFTLYPVGFIISAIFLAATLAAGCLLPASHHVLHWRCQTHHVACLMLGDIFMAIIQLAGNSLQGEICRIVAILAHFFFLATFFWLNTMCFNIWWTFRDLRPASLEKGQEIIRLRFYAAYAWGGPLIIAGLAALVDHLPNVKDQTFLRPRFGEKQCWFYGDIEIFAYFFGPIGALLIVNLIFFAATARELTCGLWKGEFVKSTTERAALGKVCLKLVVVMGVPWILDVLSWLLPSLNFLWYVTDLLNAAQGVFIFMVVGCQPQVRAALKKRLWSRNPRANASRQGNNGLSTTSNGMPSIGDSCTQNSTKTVPLETIC